MVASLHTKTVQACTPDAPYSGLQWYWTMLYSWTRRCFFRRPWWKMRPSQEVRHLEDKPTGSTSLQPAVG